MVRLENVGGYNLQEHPLPNDTVVLVPWDYGPDCSPTTWGRSAQWLEPKRQIFFNAVLRDPSYWSGHFPVFDVFVPEGQVYPSSLRSPVFSDLQGNLSPADLFSFYEIMPPVELVTEGGWGSLRELRRWSDSNQALSESFPISYLIAQLINQADRVRAAAFHPPMAGTYRIVVRYPDRTESILYLRTEASARGFFEPLTRDGTRQRSVWDGSTGFELWYVLAASEGGLPDSTNGYAAFARSWGMAWPTDSNVSWPMELEPLNLFGFLASSPSADSVLDAYSEWFDVHWGDGTDPAFTGSFHDSAGHWLLSQSSPPEGEVTMAIEGRRISTRTVTLVYSDSAMVPRDAPEILSQSERTDVRVRIWDEMLGQYIQGSHQLRRSDGSVTYSYTVGTRPDGWGQSFWLPPGRYAIQISEYPCEGKEQFLIGEIHRSFTAIAGKDIDLTIRIDPRKLKIGSSYRNPAGETSCAKAP